jgi:hypothetical protein
VANNNYPQITSVTSEALQAQIRNLLPSQEGFGTDLMAQNVIVPIIDLTSAAEGSTVPQNLQTALAFGSQTAFDVNNGTTVIANNTGFWRITAISSIFSQGGNSCEVDFDMTDGLSVKKVLAHKMTPNDPLLSSIQFDFVVFLASGESISCSSNDTRATCTGSVRQIADVNGTLVNPSGFTPQ